MHWTSFVAIAFAGAPAHALLRFYCSQLVVERLDPLVNPEQVPSTHVHQIIGGVRQQKPWTWKDTNGLRTLSTKR